MKKNHGCSSRSLRGKMLLAPHTIPSLACLFLLAGPVHAGEGDAPSPDAASPKNNYTLFVGADLDVPYDRTFYRMQRFTDFSAEVRVDGRPKRVSMRSIPSLRIGHEPKVSRSTATLAEVKVERAFSAGADPFVRWATTQVGSPELTRTVTEVNPNLPPAQPFGPRGPSVPMTETNYRDSFASPPGDTSNTGYFIGRAEMERANGGFDAIKAEFVLSSDEPLQDCYLLMICDFKMKEKDEAVQRWIHLKTLDTVEPKARKVHFVEGGLPAGFILVAHEFHLYSEGREIATNLSNKRVELSDEDAFLFLNLQYSATHRGETLPPAVVWAEAPSVLVDRVPPDVLRWPIYVQVDVDGRVVSMAADEAGLRAVPQRVEQAIKTFRFTPALEKGKPVPGKVMIRIADFLDHVPE